MRWLRLLGRRLSEDGIRAADPAAYSKQWLLFLLTVLLPSSALVVLSMRMISQERELAQKRAGERREAAGREFGAVLARTLDGLAERAAGSLQAQQARAQWLQVGQQLGFIGVANDDLLVLPWEAPAKRQSTQDPRGERVTTLLEAAERMEFGQGDLRLALARYQQASQEGAPLSPRAQASLAAARLQFKLGAAEDAHARLSWVFGLGPSVRDEFGVPFSLYAAGQGIAHGWPAGRIVPFLENLVGLPNPVEKGVLSPAATLMAAEFLEQVRSQSAAGQPQLNALADRMRAWTTAQVGAERLQAEFPLLRAELERPTGAAVEARPWILRPPWLIRSALLRGSSEHGLVAVPTAAAWELALESFGAAVGDPALWKPVAGPQPGGIWLGQAFPNLQLLMPEGAFILTEGGTRLLHSTLILFVIGITLFGAYLWWRDTRRELRLASLRSDFVSSVSHELKTPLTSVRMLAETIRLRPLEPAQRNEYLDLILGETERLGRLLKNVLDFAIIEKGVKVYQRQPERLRPIVEAAARCIQQPLQEKDLDLRCSLPEPDIIVNADRDALEQALLNLLHNAIKYSPKAALIELTAERVGSQAQIRVRDGGVGIHPRDHQRIFERFYRAPEEHNRTIPGTGLGLALVKHIIEGHAGGVTVESAPGQGSTFTLALPMAEHVEGCKAPEGDQARIDMPSVKH